MITIEDILKIDNTNINTYSGYKWVKDKVPGYSDHEHIEDISYPESNEISYGDLTEITLKQNIDNTSIDEMFLMSKYFEYSDYDNSCMVERSNFRLFKEEYGDLPGVFEVYGGYGTTDIAISLKWLLDPVNEDKAKEIIDLLNGLNDYPCIDDEDMSNMEYDAFNEAFEDFGYKDALTELQKKFNLTVYDYNEEKFKDLLLTEDSKGNPSWMIEAGGGCYIDIDEMIKPITFQMLKPVLTDYEFNDLPMVI